MATRDDFPPAVKEALAKRVGCLCSSPDCGRITTGPNSDPHDWYNLGVAAHITAAAPGPGAKRYDASLTPEQRKHPDNGIWLCQNCAKLIDDDEATYPVSVLRKWKVDKEDEIKKRLTRGVVPDIDGMPLAVSEPIQIGAMGFVQLASKTNVPCVHLHEGEPTDPTFFVSGFVLRFILRPIQTTTATVIHAIGAEVIDVAPVPAFRPLMGVYPTKISLYTLEFDDPKKAGTKRFLAKNYYRTKTEGPSDVLPYRPLTLETELPDIFDISLLPNAPGLFTLKLFAQVSVGTTVVEQDLVSSLTILVPEPEIMDGEVVTPNTMLKP